MIGKICKSLESLLVFSWNISTEVVKECAAVSLYHVFRTFQNVKGRVFSGKGCECTALSGMKSCHAISFKRSMGAGPKRII
jgi:hypothetical protein